MSASTSRASASGGQTQMDQGLLKAATSGDTRSMKHYAIQKPGILLGKTPQGNTCLHLSSFRGHQPFCKAVLDIEKSLLDIVNLDEETPLIAAVRNGHVSLATFLLGRCKLELREAILQQDKYGFNALHHAIRNGHKELALKLIDAEPKLSKHVSKCNESPMFFAVTRNLKEVYKKLVEIPVCSYSGGQHGRNCLHAAIRNEDQEFVKTIMEKRPVLAREPDDTETTPVTHAVFFGRVDMLRVMLEHDSTLGYQMDHGVPLLASAAYRCQVAAARELLEHCPDAPSYTIQDGQTLLHVAVFFDHAEFVEFILATPLLRKLVNVPDNQGKTALHLAVKKCNPRIVAALLSHKDIDATVLDNKATSAAWELSKDVQNAKTLNWNEVVMLMSKAYPQEAASSLHNLRVQAKQQTTVESRKDAKSLIQTYTSNTSLVAILITTITFAAAVTLPGGYSSAAGSEGLPIMSKKVAFKAFLICDTLAMCSSFLVAFICIIARWEDYEFLLHYRSFTKFLLWFAFMATTTAFSTRLYTVLTLRLHGLAIAICVLVALLPIITWLLGRWPVLKLQFRLGKTFNSDLLDMV